LASDPPTHHGGSSILFVWRPLSWHPLLYPIFTADLVLDPAIWSSVLPCQCGSGAIAPVWVCTSAYIQCKEGQ
jgi:hypothetical protein